MGLLEPENGNETIDIQMTDEILDASESDRFLELVQKLPDLSADEVRALNPVAPANYLVENELKGIF